MNLIAPLHHQKIKYRHAQKIYLENYASILMAN